LTGAAGFSFSSSRRQPRQLKRLGFVGGHDTELGQGRPEVG